MVGEMDQEMISTCLTEQKNEEREWFVGWSDFSIPHDLPFWDGMIFQSQLINNKWRNYPTFLGFLIKTCLSLQKHFNNSK